MSLGTGFPKIKEGREEAVLEPNLPIIDSHHHLFERPALRYMIQDYLDDAALGHNIKATVYMESQAMVRRTGPQELRSIGEVEFANGVAAMAASGTYGACEVAAAIVGFADMTIGDRIAPTLERAQSCAPDRFRGVRQIALAHSDPATLRYLTNRPPENLLAHPGFPDALRELAKRGLSFDATVFHHQLPELAAIAARTDAVIILDHAGLALAPEATQSCRDRVFDEWRKNLRKLGRNPNIFCKLGGLGTSYWGFQFYLRSEPAGYAELAAAWAPYVETAIEAFGSDRCMMASNFPNDGRSCGFVPLWNALKYIVRNSTPSEKTALFYGTAIRAYRMKLQQVATGAD